MSLPPTIEKWHSVVASRDVNELRELLSDDACFWSPVLHTPQQGKAKVLMYLGGAMQVVGNEHFHYVREIYGPNDACLEFETQVGELIVNGVDLIRWNDQGQITDFKVMLRPLKAISAVQQGMAALLQAHSGA